MAFLKSTGHSSMWPIAQMSYGVRRGEGEGEREGRPHEEWTSSERHTDDEDGSTLAGGRDALYARMKLQQCRRGALGKVFGNIDIVRIVASFL